MAEEFIKIKDLTPKAKRVNTVFKVVNVEAAKNVRSKKDRTPHAVTEATVGDDTGTVLMTVWDESLETIKPGKAFSLVNGYITLFRGTMRLNIGKYGELTEVEKPDFEVDLKNNMSSKVFQEDRRQYEGFGSGSFWPGQ